MPVERALVVAERIPAHRSAVVHGLSPHQPKDQGSRRRADGLIGAGHAPYHPLEA
jgi:hypothetical protein